MVATPTDGTDPEAKFENLIAEGIKARKEGERSNWRLGDLAQQVKVEYGKGRLQEFADRIDVLYMSLLNYRWVAEAFPKSFRRLKLSWTHHQLVARRKDRHDLLAMAESEGWSIRQLLDELVRLGKPKRQVRSRAWGSILFEMELAIENIERALAEVCDLGEEEFRHVVEKMFEAERLAHSVFDRVARAGTDWWENKSDEERELLEKAAREGKKEGKRLAKEMALKESSRR